MSNGPAQPPPPNATTNHQAEVTVDSLLNELSVAYIRFDRMRYIEHVHITPEVREVNLLHDGIGRYSAIVGAASEDRFRSTKTNPSIIDDGG